MAPKSNSSDDSGDDNDDLVINVDKENNASIHRTEPTGTVKNNIHDLLKKGYFHRKHFYYNYYNINKYILCIIIIFIRTFSNTVKRKNKPSAK